MGKPPALPGDSQSLTFPGIDETSPICERLDNHCKDLFHKTCQTSSHTSWEFNKHFVSTLEETERVHKYSKNQK